MSDAEDPRTGRRLFRPPVAREVENELAFHIAMRARELEARGESPAEAQRKAVAEFGDLARVTRECRQIGYRRERGASRRRIIGEVGQDVAFAFRLLERRPMFTALAVLTIAFGIGAATSIFSVVDGVLLRDLPFRDPGRLVAVWIAQPSLTNDPVISRLAERTVLGSGEYFALRAQSSAFSNIGVWSIGSAMLLGSTATEPVRMINASASLLDVLGERPVLGRGFTADENVLDGPKVALVSWEAWNDRFGGDSALVGRRVQLDVGSYTIVGVLPRGLRLDRTAAPAPFWTPALQSTYEQPERRNRTYNVVARLKPGISADAAERETVRIFRATDGDTSLAARVVNWQYDQTKETREPLFILLGASGLLLLIGCVNVAMLMVAESSSRERELAARIALGASRARIIRQLLAESMTIAALGAALGASIAWALTRALVALAPERIPGIDTAGVDLRALLFTTMCAACAGVLFGLAPAVSLARTSEAATIRVGVGQSARAGRRTQRWLVATEIALSVVLLFGATLLARSLDQLSAVDPGFRTRDVLAVTLAAPLEFRRDDARALAYVEEAVARLAAVPGVVAVSAGENPPFGGRSSSSPVEVEGRVYDRNRAPSTEQRAVLPGYFAALGIPVRAGRVFNATDAEAAELVVVVSEAAAKRDFPGESAPGRRVCYQGTYRRIVGVVGDVRTTRLTRDAEPAIYTPMRQYMAATPSLIVRSTSDLRVLAPALRAALQPIDPRVSIASIDRMSVLVGRSYEDERYRTVIVGAFAVLAALLAGVGLYGVTLRAVARRTREVGIRIALGATPVRATRLLMAETLKGGAAGVIVGIPLALFAGRRLTPYLFDVSPTDAVALLVVVSFLGGVALVASGLPARRAGRSNPARVLSAE